MAETATKKARKRKNSSYRSFRMSKRIKPPVQKSLPTIPVLLRQTVRHIWQNKRVFLGVIAIYILLNLIFVKGFASTVDLGGIRSDLIESGTAAGTEVNVALLGVLFGSGNTATTDVGTLYQSIILVLTSLGFIWLFRQTSTDNKNAVKIKQPFYEGMAPLVPFLLVLCVIGLQLLPMLAGVGILSTVLSNGLAVTFVEQFVWALLTLSLTLLSFYMISSSMFALIIVTLPGTQPLGALRSARKVVQYRRAQLMRKLLLLTILLSFIFGLLVFLCIVVAPVLAEWFFFALGAFFLPLTIGLVYKIYRALL